MKIVKINKGLNIPLKGAVADKEIIQGKPDVIAIKPDDFIGFVPKMFVNQGDKINVGTPLCHNKNDEKVQICSPVSGEVLEVLRGEKRKILAIKIKNDFNYTAIKSSLENTDNQDRESILKTLLQSGLFSLIRQRPYDVIPNADIMPRDIFVSCFDSSPLAPDYNAILAGMEQPFQAGINILKKLTEGNVFLGLSAASDNLFFQSIKNVEINHFKGPHPAGNVGVQIHHTKAINKGEIVWYLNPQDIVIIGKYFSQGIYDASRIVALTGQEIEKPVYVRTIIGSNISGMMINNAFKANARIVSGNVLTGTRVESDGFLGYYHQQITAIPEGNYFEFIGWAMPGLKKYSSTGLFPSKLFPKSNFKIDTNYHGGLRAFVMSGEYEKVFPFDIYPVYLLKAILAQNIDKMEELGIYEVSAEDFALCDFVCTSKIEAQQIVSQGLELIRKEMS